MLAFVTLEHVYEHVRMMIHGWNYDKCMRLVIRYNKVASEHVDLNGNWWKNNQ